MNGMHVCSTEFQYFTLLNHSITCTYADKYKVMLLFTLMILLIRAQLPLIEIRLYGGKWYCAMRTTNNNHTN